MHPDIPVSLFLLSENVVNTSVLKALRQKFEVAGKCKFFDRFL